MSGLTVLGIDPGNEGALVFLEDDGVILEPMPQTFEHKLDLPELVRLLGHYVPISACVILEMAAMRRGQATQAGTAQWRGFGRIEGILAALGAKPQLVYAAVWSASFPHGVTETDPQKRYAAIKKARATIAHGLFPGIDFKRTPKCKTDHEGLVDALLIAEYGRRLHHETEPA